VDAFSPRPDRRYVDLTGHALLADGTKAPASVVDLAYEGCKIRCGTPLRPGDRVKLAVFRLGLIDAEVRWYANGEAGLTFAPSEAGPSPHWPRRSQRVSVNAIVTLRKPGKHHYQAKVSDMSPEGCRAEFVDCPVTGDLVFIKFEGLETLDAEVCWVNDDQMGLNFAKSFHPAVFDLLMQRFAVGD